MYIVTLLMLVKEMPQNSLGLVLLISFGVESREQSSSPYTVTNSLGGLEDVTDILCPHFYSFFHEMAKILTLSNLCC